MVIIFKNKTQKSKNMENTEIEKSNILYISNFPKRIEKAELEKFLSEYGPLISLNIIQKNEFSFAFAQYDDIRDAAFAVKELNQKIVYGMNLKVQYKNKKIKSKETIQSQQQKSRQSTAKNSSSSHSVVERNSNILSSNIVDRVKQEQRNMQKSPRQRSRNRKQRQSQISDFSLSPSRQRSREKNKRFRQSEHIDLRRSSYCKQNYQPRDRPFQKERQKRNRNCYSEQSEIQQMLQMIKYFTKNLKRLQRKIQEFTYQQFYDGRTVNRKRL